MKITGVQDLTHRAADPPLTPKRWFSMKVEELLIFAVLVAVSTLAGCSVEPSPLTDCKKIYDTQFHLLEFSRERRSLSADLEEREMWSKLGDGVLQNIMNITCQPQP